VLPHVQVPEARWRFSLHRGAWRRAARRLVVGGDPPCIATSGFDSDEDGTFWEWTSTHPGGTGGGLTLLTDAPLGTTYTFILKFALDPFLDDGYMKIIDFQDRGPDDGLYLLTGEVSDPFEAVIYYDDDGDVDVASTQTVRPGDVLDLIVVRQQTSGPAGTFTVYARFPNGAIEQLFTFVDPQGKTIPFVTQDNKSKLGFFFDDADTEDEGAPGGRVYELRGWAGVALTLEQITAAVTPAQPEPTPPITPSYTG